MSTKDLALLGYPFCDIDVGRRAIYIVLWKNLHRHVGGHILMYQRTVVNLIVLVSNIAP